MNDEISEMCEKVVFHLDELSLKERSSIFKTYFMKYVKEIEKVEGGVK